MITITLAALLNLYYWEINLWLSDDAECDQLHVESEYSRDMNPIMDSLSVPPPVLDNENVEQAPPKVQCNVGKT